MHPEDAVYFARFAEDARRANLSLEDYYIQIQMDTHRDPQGIRSNLKPQKTVGLRLACRYMGSEDSILVTGAGVGHEVEWLQQAGFSRVTALDISAERMELCRRRLGIETICADMRRTGLADRCYDHVLTRQSLHHLFYPYRALEELARIARCTVSIVSEPARTWFKETYRRALRRRVISRVQIYEYQFPVQDVDRYMAFNGFGLELRRLHLESARVPYALHQALSIVPFIRNRFTAVYRRFSSTIG